MSAFDAEAVTADLRQRVVNGENVTPEEYRSVLEEIRKAREAGEKKAATKRAAKEPPKPSAPVSNPNSLFNSVDKG